MYKLIGSDGKEYLSEEKGTLGGNKSTKVYGRLDCPTALRYIAKGQYVKNRVFFKDEATALAAGYIPCGHCMREKYKQYMEDKEGYLKRFGKQMDFREKMHSGALYQCMDESILVEQFQCLDKLYEYNQTRPSQQAERTALLKEMLAEVGEGCYVEAPLHANWGGHHVHFGKYVYCNFNVTLVDDTHIYVGDYTELGPNVVIATAGHPILPELREQVYQYNAPVRIGRNCWLGAGVIVVPGITIGDNTVVGAGSVVTKDIPSNVIAVGNPCKVLREINEHDREYYFKDRKINWDELKG